MKFYTFLICKKKDTLGLHRVENSSHIEPAVSLHLYCPPFNECSIFNKQTGKRTKCQVTFWSKFGEKRNKVRKKLSLHYDLITMNFSLTLSKQDSFTNSIPEDK